MMAEIGASTRRLAANVAGFDINGMSPNGEYFVFRPKGDSTWAIYSLASAQKVESVEGEVFDFQVIPGPRIARLKPVPLQGPFVPGTPGKVRIILPSSGSAPEPADITGTFIHSAWSLDGKCLVTLEREPGQYAEINVRAFDTSTGAPLSEYQIYDPDDTVIRSNFVWSRNSERLLLPTWKSSPPSVSIHHVSVRTGKVEIGIVPVETDKILGGASLSPDGNLVVVNTFVQDEFQMSHSTETLLVRLADGRTSVLPLGHFFGWLPDSRSLIYGAKQLYLIDAAGLANRL